MTHTEKFARLQIILLQNYYDVAAISVDHILSLYPLPLYHRLLYICEVKQYLGFMYNK